MTQRLLFDLPASMAPPPDLTDTYRLSSAPAPLASPARQLLLAPVAPEIAFQPPPVVSSCRLKPLSRHQAPDSWPIPPRCPVTGGPTCHRDGCYHFHAVDNGRCSHPQARKP